MTQIAARVAAWPAWGQVAFALIFGALGSFSHAPFSFGPAILAPLVAGFVLLRGAGTLRAALIRGWALGLGDFAFTLSWITEPFQVDAATTGWMAPFALVLLALLLGSFWAAALTFARWAGGQAWALILAWSGAELLRAHVFTGFPWAAPPQALVDGLAGQGLAWLGPHGMMLALVATAGVIVAAISTLLSAVAAVTAIAAIVIPVSPPNRTDTAYTIRRVQPNAPQHEKWDPERIPVFVNRQIGYTADGPVPDLVLWPETALPYLAENAQPAFDVIAQAARGAPVVLGIQRRGGSDYFNSLVMLDADGQVTQTYDKHHLVPFGEYMPAEWLFRRIESGGLAARAEGGYTGGPGPQLLDLGALGRALPLICYEVVFAHNVGGAPARPAFLMQLTNDAWFGSRSGPQQHLAQARMRAIEQGLPMVRAANTGISAMIDPKGHITASLPLNTAGYIDVVLPAPGKPTLYSQTGDTPWVLLVLAGLFWCVLRHARARRTDAIDEAQPDG